MTLNKNKIIILIKSTRIDRLEALAEVSQAGVEIYLVDQEQSPTVCRENNVQCKIYF
jgi:hypothetical protein